MTNDLKKDLTVESVREGMELIALFLSPSDERLSQNSAGNVWKRCLLSAGGWSQTEMGVL